MNYALNKERTGKLSFTRISVACVACDTLR